MEERWYLKPTNNINQLLRVRNDVSIDYVISKFKNLIIIKHHYHIADDIMFPDPACLSFFTAFEQNHLEKLEKDEKLIVVAVDVFEGQLRYFIYCEDTQQTVYDCISFLKSSSLYKCDFEIVLNENGKAIKEL